MIWLKRLLRIWYISFVIGAIVVTARALTFHYFHEKRCYFTGTPPNYVVCFTIERATDIIAIMIILTVIGTLIISLTLWILAGFLKDL